MHYKGSCRLDRAIQNWTVTTSIEDATKKRVLKKIRSYFDSKVHS
jgi:hypothetical protein